jgi:ABC-type antimicrobial peptide transport system permease subunit
LRSYINVRDTKIDIINGIPFFSLLLVLFVPLLQQLILPIYGGKRILILVMLFAIFLSILYLIHPGFRLASNSFIVVISVMLIVLTAPSCGILISSLSWGTRKIARKISGLHKIETGRLNVISLSLSVGIENIRKRKLRSFLIFITITLTVASLVTFVSISSTSMPTFQRIPFEPPYTGIFIKQVEWVYPLDYEFVEAFKHSLEVRGLSVMPRAVLYTTHPAATNPTIPYFIRNLEIPEKIAEIYAAVGLPPETLDFFEKLKESIIEGRWFTYNDEWTCILSDKIAEKLSLTKLPGKIVFMGKNFTVIGIVNSKIFDNIWDINVESLPPWDARLPEQDFIHASSSEVLIVDYNSLQYFDPKIASISIKCRSVEEARNLMVEISTRFGGLKIWGGFDKEAVIISKERRVAVHGFEMQLPILAISALMIFNIMLGSIYERKKDIYTFSTVGASPFHVIIIFLGEALMFSIISGMLGYLLATLLIRSIASHMFFIMNYASTWVITAIGIAMLVVMLSAIYPLIIASKMVTPSLERVWRIPTKPREDVWEIPLPFVFSVEEIDGVCAFIIEYFRTHMGEGSPDFSIANLIYKEEQLENQLIRKITFTARLAPYEFGVSQDVNIIFNILQGSDVWHVTINLYRKAGPRDVWEKNNYKFINILRKQLLLWRTLKYEDKRIYMIRATELLGGEKHE